MWEAITDVIGDALTESFIRSGYPLAGLAIPESALDEAAAANQHPTTKVFPEEVEEAVKRTTGVMDCLVG